MGPISIAHSSDSGLPTGKDYPAPEHLSTAQKNILAGDFTFFLQKYFILKQY